MNLRLLLIVFSYSMLATSLVFVWTMSTHTPDTDLFWFDETRLEVQEKVEDYYVDPIDPERAEELFDAAMWGYVSQLDPFSRYFDAKGKQELEEDTSGQFGGIGVQVRATERGVLIAAVRIKGPADIAGIVPGEVIEKVNGEELKGRDLNEMIEHVKGKPGTVVVLGLRAPDETVRAVSVTRDLVELDSVPLLRMIGGSPGDGSPGAGSPAVGYFRVSGFSENTGKDVRNAVDLLIDQGAESLVMDLRYNAGGVVSGAVDAAAVFLPAEEVVCRTRGRFRDETTVRSYTTQASSLIQSSGPDAGKPPGKPVNLPVVVLVNAESASASEILAGALQDHGRALLVGERTYGKFVMQTLFPLLSRDALVRFTTSRYETPKGRSAQRSERLGARGGLLPDLRVSLGGDEQRDRLVRWFGQETDERIWRVMETDEEEAPPDDAQLSAAVDLLRGASPPAESLVPGR